MFISSRWLVAYPHEESMVIESLSTLRRFAVSDPAFLKALRVIDTVSDPAETARRLSEIEGLTVEESEAVILLLKDAGMLGEPEANLPDAVEWARHGWSHAGKFVAACRDYPYVDYESPDAPEIDRSRMRTYLAQTEPPPIYKDYPDAQFVELPRELSHSSTCSLARALQAEPEYAEGVTRLGMQELGELLYLGLGQTGSLRFGEQGEFLRRTSPSGGGRHPIEAYVIVLDADLPAGVHHYSVRRHGLEQISPTVDARLHEIVDDLAEIRFRVGALVVLTSVFDRSMWRYREPRSYRAVLHDLGHVEETLRLSAASIGLATFLGHGFRDGAFDELLGIDGIMESSLRFMAIG